MFVKNRIFFGKTRIMENKKETSEKGNKTRITFQWAMTQLATAPTQGQRNETAGRG
jgi:hypothetical protein